MTNFFAFPEDGRKRRRKIKTRPGRGKHEVRSLDHGDKPDRRRRRRKERKRK